MTSIGDLEIIVGELSGGGTLVRLRGELDLATVSEFQEALARAKTAARVVIDLTECSFLDSSGMRALLARASADGDVKGPVSLVASDPGMRKSLEIAGVDSVLPIHATVAEALLELDSK